MPAIVDIVALVFRKNSRHSRLVVRVVLDLRQSVDDLFAGELLAEGLVGRDHDFLLLRITVIIVEVGGKNYGWNFTM